MKTIKAILAAVLVSSLMPVSAFASAPAQDQIAEYQSFIKREYGVNTALKKPVLSQKAFEKTMDEFTSLDSYLDAKAADPKSQVKLPEMQMVDCLNPVCGGGEF